MKKSAGILMYRIREDGIEFFLVHYGGPFWAKKDLGTWSIPKGEFFDDENAQDAAVREFKEETGHKIVLSSYIELTPIKQKGGKMIYAFAFKGDLDPSKLKSNEFELEWPPKSGIKKSFPEVDKGAWFSTEEAKIKINPAQILLINDLLIKIIK